MYLTIHDETSTGSILNQLKVELGRDRISIYDLIRTRVFHEVNLYNQKRPDFFYGLVQPSCAEVVFNGYKLDKKHKIDPEVQFQIALEAFSRKEFLIIVDEKPVHDPEFCITLQPQSRVSFLKLAALVGG
ncbi:MAG: hypothetical protein R3C61_11125 [Bacteroidia bacterium]